MRVVAIWMAIGLLVGCATTPVAHSPLPGEPVATGISLLRGTFVPGEQPDGNTVLLRGKKGWVVVDSGRHARHSDRIIAATNASGLPIVAIVNTHWHLDHVAGNAALRRTFPRAEVYASDALGDALHGFLADYRAQLRGMVDRPGAASTETQAGWREEIARIDPGEQLLPTRVLTRAQDVRLAGRRIHLGLERSAVSDGDVWLFDPATRTLVTGDLVTLPVPLLDTACGAGWQQALSRIDALDFDRLVPGHGAVMDHAQFATYRAAFDHLLECAASGDKAEVCKAGWLADAQSLIPSQDDALANSLLDYYITQVLRAPPERRYRYCRKETTQ